LTHFPAKGFLDQRFQVGFAWFGYPGALRDRALFFGVLFASLSIPAVVLVAAILGGLLAAGLMYLLGRRTAAAPAIPKGGEDPTGGKLEDYQLILDTLGRSNVLLWWARVWREGSTFQWKIRTPPQLQENPSYRLASLINEGGLWKTEQAPDHLRTVLTAETALAGGASGYQHEFRILGSDSVHWLSEEVVIRLAGSEEWNLAGVVVDVTKRHEAGSPPSTSEKFSIPISRRECTATGSGWRRSSRSSESTRGTSR
jgi:hypothetical protein